MRPVQYPPRPPADEPKFRYQAKIENTVDVAAIHDRALDATFPISNRELLAVATSYRKQTQELTTSKRVAVNFAEDDEIDSYLTRVSEESSQVAHFDVSRYDPSSPSAAVSLPLRVIYPDFAPGYRPECILDGGSQIVVIRRDVWERIGAPIAANKAMSMESANSGTTKTLGLIEDYPIKLGPVTVLLQIQVLDDAPFEVLLGRPFFDATSCSEVSRSGGGHEIHLVDPTTGNPYVFPTAPRKPVPNRLAQKPQNASVNFR